MHHASFKAALSQVQDQLVNFSALISLPLKTTITHRSDIFGIMSMSSTSALEILKRLHNQREWNIDLCLDPIRLDIIRLNDDWVLDTLRLIT